MRTKVEEKHRARLLAAVPACMSEADRTTLYKLYDKHDALLYVGISLSLAHRMAEHRREKEWWRQVARIEVHHASSREVARFMEFSLIQALRPLHNIQCQHVSAEDIVAAPRGKAATLARYAQLIAMREAGMTNIEIAAERGTSAARVADSLRKARNRGLHVPPAPKRTGARAGGAKLTQEQVERICEMVAAGATKTAVARAFGVTQPTVRFIMRGKTWPEAHGREWTAESVEDGRRRAAARTADAFTARLDDYSALRRDGLLNPEIAALRGVTNLAVAHLFSRGRRLGRDVPPSPWYQQKAKP